MDSSVFSISGLFRLASLLLPVLCFMATTACSDSDSSTAPTDSQGATPPTASSGTPGAEVDVGERLFIETRFAQAFKVEGDRRRT